MARLNPHVLLSRYISFGKIDFNARPLLLLLITVWLCSALYISTAAHDEKKAAQWPAMVVGVEPQWQVIP